MKTDSLFKLVHSLDDRERRLYRKRLGQNLRLGKNNLLTLFNAFESTSNFDAVSLARKIRDPQLKAQLPSYLTRLFEHLTEFLCEINEFPSIDTQLNAACERATLLYERGLFESARKELKRAQKLAQDDENYIQLLRMADLERSFFFSENSHSLEDFKEARKFRDQEFMQALSDQVSLKLNHFEALYHSKTRSGKQFDKEKSVTSLVGESVHRVIGGANASTTDLLLLDTIGITALIEEDFDTAYAAYHRMDSLWVTNPARIAQNALLYIGFITNFLNACLLKGRHTEFRSLLANLKTVRFQNEAHALQLKMALLYIEQLFCLNRFEYDKGIAMGPEIEAVLKKNRGRLNGSRVISLYFNLGSMHFLKGEYSKANRLFAQINNIQGQDYRKDVQTFVPVFQLLLFIAMKDHELLSSRLRARQRATQGAAANPLEQAIVHLAQQVLKFPHAQKDGLEVFRASLLEIIESGKGTVGVGECLFWAEGTLVGKLPGEVLKEYMQQHN